MKYSLVSFITICCLYSYSSLANDENIRLKRIEAILDLSGTSKQVLGLSEFTKQAEGPCSNQPGLNEVHQARIRKIVSEELKPNLILLAIKNKMQAELSNEEINQLEEHYNQDDVKSMSRIEEEASTPSGYKAMQEYAETLKANPPSKQRLQLLIDFDKEIKGSENLISLSINTLIALNTALEKKVTDKDYENHRKAITPALTQHVIIASLYVNKDVSDKDLLKAISAYRNNKSLLKMGNITMQEYSNGFKSWGENMGIKIKQYKQQIAIMEKIK